MKIVEVDLESTSPYSQSRKHDTPKLHDKEDASDHDARTWREKCTYNEDGIVCIPAMALKQALDSVAKRLGMQVPGKGKATYTKHFLGGVICEADVPLGIRKDDVPMIMISANATGIRGVGKRVPRRFPQISHWRGTARFVVLDDMVKRDVFERHLAEAGRFIGIGRFRPEVGGLNGRFRPLEYRWTEL